MRRQEILERLRLFRGHPHEDYRRREVKSWLQSFENDVKERLDSGSMTDENKACIDQYQLAIKIAQSYEIADDQLFYQSRKIEAIESARDDIKLHEHLMLLTQISQSLAENREKDRWLLIYGDYLARAFVNFKKSSHWDKNILPRQYCSLLAADIAKERQQRQAQGVKATTPKLDALKKYARETGFNEDYVIWVVESYGRRNEIAHANLSEFIEGEEWEQLAVTIVRDAQDIEKDRRIPNNDARRHLRQAIKSLEDEYYFEIERDIVMEGDGERFSLKSYLPRQPWKNLQKEEERAAKKEAEEIAAKERHQVAEETAARKIAHKANRIARRKDSDAGKDTKTEDDEDPLVPDFSD